jgi:hypothetical protein
MVRLALAAAALAAGAGSALPVRAEPGPLVGVEVATAVVLPRREVSGVGTAELSALAPGASREELWSASDRGRIVKWRLRWGQSLLEAADPVAGLGLAARAGRGFNIEALARVPQTREQPARLLLAPEQGTSAWSLEPPLQPGAALRPEAWPTALRDTLADEGSRHGVEAVDWHPRHGMLAALQRPGAEDNAVHTLHAADGRRWRLAGAAPKSDLKAIERIGEHRLLVLERLRGRESGGRDQRRFVLRELDLRSACDSPCNPPAFAVLGPGLDGRDHFEGMACFDAQTCLIVSDDGGDAPNPARLVQLRLRRSPR